MINQCIYVHGIEGPWLGYDNSYPLHTVKFGLIKFGHYIYSNNKHTLI